MNTNSIGFYEKKYIGTYYLLSDIKHTLSHPYWPSNITMFTVQVDQMNGKIHVL